MSCFELREGVTHCEDVALPAIAHAVGTPVFVYSANAMRAQARALRAALSSLDDPLIAFHYERLREGETGVKIKMTEK